MFDGKNMMITGDFKITGDYVTINSVNVKRNATIAQSEGNLFIFKSVKVSGTTSIEKKVKTDRRAKGKITPSTNEVQVNFQQSSLGELVNNNENTKLNLLQNVKVSKIRMNRNGVIATTANTSVVSIVFESNVKATLLGTSVLPDVTLKENAEVNINVLGSIDTLLINGKNAKITSLRTTINNLVIPHNIHITDIVSNLSKISENIKKLNGSEYEYKNTELTVLHTNDTHAYLNNISRRATAIQEERSKIKNSLLLDAGDVFSGTKYEGLADAEFMNILDYDAMTFGNHEFDKNSQLLANFVGALKFPLLTSNINFSEDQYLSKFQTNDYLTESVAATIAPALIKEIDGEKVGLIGLTTKDSEVLSNPGPTVKFKEVIESAKNAVEGLENEGINKIIALTHIGYNADVTLAKAVREIDVIVGGHSHNRLEEAVVIKSNGAKTLIVQAEDQSKYLGKLEVEFNPEGEIVRHKGSLLDLNAINPDNSYVYAENEKIAKKLKGYTEAINKLQNKKIGYTEIELDGVRANVRTKETNLGNLITDAMLTEAKKTVPQTSIAFQNGGGIRTSIDKGNISLGEILTVMPFGNMLVTLELTYDEIKGALENSVSSLPIADGRFLHVSGLRYEYDLSMPTGSRIVNIELEEVGEYVPINFKKTYFVATNAFIAGGGDFYSSLKEVKENGRITNQYVVDYDVFVNYLTINPSVNPGVEGRIVEHIAAGEASGTATAPKGYRNNILVNATEIESLSYINVTGILYIKGKDEGVLKLESVNAKKIVYIN